MNPAPQFTARQIASALRCTVRNIRKQLADYPAGALTVRGKAAHAWTFSALPAQLRERLTVAAIRQHLPGADALLALQSAPVPAPEPSEAIAQLNLHRDLADWLADYQLAGRQQFTRGDRETVWAESLRHYQALRAVTPDAEQTALKSGLVAFLCREARGLIGKSGRPIRAMARAFNRNLAVFSTEGRPALRDLREVNSGNWRASLCQACWKKVVDAAILHEGRLSLAWRELKKNKVLCPDCLGLHTFDPRRDKSYVPRSIREAATPLVDAALPWRKSKAAGRAAGPSIPRDWNDTSPGDWFTADDMTPNTLVFDYGLDGKPRFFRPELLYIADERTSYPLCFLLVPAPAEGGKASYNGRHVRQLLLNCHDRFGLPHYGFKFENGVWRSRTVRDEACPDWIGFSETEDGFQSLPDLVKIRHFRPRNPRAKVIEGDFNIHQARMSREAGNVGRNERETKSDAIKAFMRRAMSGKQAPEHDAWHVKDFAKLLSAVFEEFANSPQNGARLPGVSPAEAWKAGQLAKPLRKLPDELRYILATSRTIKKVTQAGFMLRFGKHEAWTYAGERLAPFIGQHVIAHYHFDLPEFVTVFDCKRSMKPFSIKGIRLPANTATRDQLSEAHRHIDGFNRVAKTIAGSVENPFAVTVTRDNDYSPEQREAGLQIEADKQQFRKSKERQADDPRERGKRDGARALAAAGITLDRLG